MGMFPYSGVTCKVEQPQRKVGVTKVIMAETVVQSHNYAKAKVDFGEYQHLYFKFRPEWCISTIYHACYTPFWSGTLKHFHVLNSPMRSHTGLRGQRFLHCLRLTVCSSGIEGVDGLLCACFPFNSECVQDERNCQNYDLSRNETLVLTEQ